MTKTTKMTSFKQITRLMILLLVGCFVYLNTSYTRNFLDESTQPTKSINTTTSTTEKDKTDNDKYDDNICSFLSNRIDDSDNIPSRASLWTKNLPKILEASQHPVAADQKKHRRWMASILKSLSPSILSKGIKTTPSHASLKHIMDKIHKRLSYDVNSSNDPGKQQRPPPLKIAVFGGSVTAGTLCHVISKRLKDEKISSNETKQRHRRRRHHHRRLQKKTGRRIPPIYGKNCVWPHRLSNLLNNLAGTDVVQVTNLAFGGTNSDLAKNFIKYWMYPPELLPDGPDIIILAYSTNDSHRLNNMTNDEFTTSRRKILQEFMREVSIASGYPCNHRPVVLIVDEYLGTLAEDALALDEMSYNRLMVESSQWYENAMAVSYADVVRKFVYADTTEDVFSANWFGNDGGFKGQTHFGQSAHQTVAWTLAFAIMEVMGRFCDDDLFYRDVENGGGGGDDDDLRAVEKETKYLIDNVDPPLLTDDLRLLNITRKWNDNKLIMERERNACASSNKTGANETTPVDRLPCVLAFIAGPMGNVKTDAQLHYFLKPMIVSNDGWSAVTDISAGGWSRKNGWVAIKPNATFTLVLTTIPKVVKSVTLQTLKSYGSKWENSVARFTLSMHENGAIYWSDHLDISGEHNSNTSIVYQHNFDLGNVTASRGSDIWLKVDLISGTTFKIVGMMFCDR